MMHARQIGLLLVLAAGFACRSPSTVPEQGAVLLRLSSGGVSPAPDELRVWAYHDGGRLWDGARVPERGTLDSKLGTILIAPGAIQGALRIHIRALAAGTRVADGMLSIPSLASGGRTFDLRLESAVPADSDGDGVPDVIDDCVDLANPGQGGCSTASASDASVPSSTLDGGHPVEARDTGRAGAEDGSVKSESADADKGVVPDAIAAVIADAESQAKDARDALVDAPPIIIPDAGSKNGIEGGIPLVADTGTDLVTDGKVVIDLAGAGDVLPDVIAPADLAVAADTHVALDSIPASPDVNPGDTPVVDACGTNCKKTQGEPCALDDECESSFCADGVCCTNSCAGPCRSCNQPDSTGTCRGYTAGTDPEGECTGGSKCNGVGACGAAPPPGKDNGQLCGSGSECLSGVCKDGVCCNEACNQPCQTCGSGTCRSVIKADDKPECTDTMTCNPAGKCVTKSS